MVFFRNRNALSLVSENLTTYSVSDSIVTFTLARWHPPHVHAAHYYLHTAYTPSPSPHPHLSRSRELRSLGFFLVWPDLVPPMWPLDPELGLPFFYPWNPVYPRSLDPSVLEFSLSLYRHPIICILFSSRVTSYNKHNLLVFNHTDTHI